MALASPPTAVAELRRWLERVEAHGRTEQAVLPFGLDAIDRSLPQGGLPLGHLHEVIEAGAAGEYAGLATLFIAGILARLSGPVLWCLRGRDLFAPALARIGLHPDRVIYCETWKDRDVLPAMEEGLRFRQLGTCRIGSAPLWAKTGPSRCKKKWVNPARRRNSGSSRPSRRPPIVFHSARNKIAISLRPPAGAGERSPARWVCGEGVAGPRRRVWGTRQVTGSANPSPPGPNSAPFTVRGPLQCHAQGE
jgi:hypothetical protein